MPNRTVTLACCLATALAVGTGCRSTAVDPDPATAYDREDVIVSGLPPLACGITKPVIVSVIDETSRSRVFYLDATDEGFQGLLKFDVDKQALILTSGEGPSEITLLKIDPKHRYTVVFTEAEDDDDPRRTNRDGAVQSQRRESEKVIAPVTRPTDLPASEGVGRDIEEAGNRLRDAARDAK